MGVVAFSDTSVLLAQLAGKDQRAFKVVYEKYNKRIFTVSLKMLNSVERAEEITQEVFLKLWNHQEVFQDAGHLEAWLRTAAKHFSLNAFRRLMLEKKLSTVAGNKFKEAHNDTEETVLLNDAKSILSEAIENLPGKQREIYKLCQQQGYTYEEAAASLNISVNTLKTHLKRAVASVRLHMEANTGIASILILLKIF